MLPLLPALILLLLQGPSGIDRTSWDSRLGEWNALQRHLSAGIDGVAAADEVVLASLLAVGDDGQLSKALLQIFASVPLEESEPVYKATPEKTPQAPVPPALGSPQSGFFACRRSRDGPILVA